MSKSLRFSPLILIVLGLIGLLVYLNLPQPEKQREGFRGDTPVRVQEVRNQELSVVIEGLGTVKANESVVLTVQQADIVQSIHFSDGDRVEQGQLLMTLNNREEIARINELEVNIQEAKRQLTRIKNLAKQNVASEQILDEQQAEVEALVAQREVAEVQLAELEIKAPFGGLLGIRQVSLGALVRPGDELTTLDDLSKVKVDFNVAERHLPSVKVGQTISAASIAYKDETFIGKISGVDTRVDPVTRSFKVRALIDNPEFKLRPGMLLQIIIEKRVIDTLVVPEKALVPIEDKQYVFVIKEGTAERRQVTIGIRKPGIAQIVSGLEAGEQVVTEGTLQMRNGAKVKVLNPSQQGG